MLYEERSAVRAGDRLGVTQSAVSHALGRLREHFGDPLFVRSPSGLKPTPRAANLAPVLDELFARLHEALAPVEFDPATTRREFTIAAPLYLCDLLMPLVIARARREAPHARFRIWNTRNVAQLLDLGKVDLTLGYYEDEPERFRKWRLLTDRFAWVAGRDTPLPPQPMSLADIAAFPRIMVAAMEDKLGVAEQITEVGLRKQVVLGSDEILRHSGLTHIAPAPIAVYDAKITVAMVMANPIIGYVPHLLVRDHVGRGELVEIEVPDGRSEFDISVLWRREADHDPALRWIGAIMTEVSDKFAGALERSAAPAA
jgi:DNA-binding transcriptional LysR family regulator